MPSFSRRRFLRTSAAGIGAAGLLPRLYGPAAAEDTITVGFIYVGPKDDFGYNQAHAEGAAAVAAMDGVTVLEEENVPEFDRRAEHDALDGRVRRNDVAVPDLVRLFRPAHLEVAPQYPDIRFQHCGGLWTEGDPANAGSCFGYIGMGQSLNGIVAGHATRTGKLGFVAAKPIPQVLNNINSYLLNARAVDPGLTH